MVRSVLTKSSVLPYHFLINRPQPSKACKKPNALGLLLILYASLLLRRCFLFLSMNLVYSFCIIEDCVILVVGWDLLYTSHHTPPHTVVKVWMGDRGGHELREGRNDDGISLLIKDGQRPSRQPIAHGNVGLVPTEENIIRISTSNSTRNCKTEYNFFYEELTLLCFFQCPQPLFPRRLNKTG